MECEKWPKARSGSTTRFRTHPLHIRPLGDCSRKHQPPAPPLSVTRPSLPSPQRLDASSMPQRSSSASITLKTISVGINTRLVQRMIIALAAIWYSVIQATLMRGVGWLAPRCTSVRDNHTSGRSRVHSGRAATVSRQSLWRSSVSIDPGIAFVSMRFGRVWEGAEACA